MKRIVQPLGYFTSDSDLKLLLATMPPWPGAQEAVAVSEESLAEIGSGDAM